TEDMPLQVPTRLMASNMSLSQLPVGENSAERLGTLMWLSDCRKSKVAFGGKTKWISAFRGTPPSLFLCVYRCLETENIISAPGTVGVSRSNLDRRSFRSF